LQSNRESRGPAEHRIRLRGPWRTSRTAPSTREWRGHHRKPGRAKKCWAAGLYTKPGWAGVSQRSRLAGRSSTPRTHLPPTGSGDPVNRGHDRPAQYARGTIQSRRYCDGLAHPTADPERAFPRKNHRTQVETTRNYRQCETATVRSAPPSRHRSAAWAQWFGRLKPVQQTGMPESQDEPCAKTFTQAYCGGGTCGQKFSAVTQARGG